MIGLYKLISLLILHNIILVECSVPTLSVQKLDRKLIERKRQDTREMCRLFNAEVAKTDENSHYVIMGKTLTETKRRRSKRDVPMPEEPVKYGNPMLSEKDAQRVENIVDKLYDDVDEDGKRIPYRKKKIETTTEQVGRNISKSGRRFDFAPAELLGPQGKLKGAQENVTGFHVPWPKRWYHGIVPYFIDPKTYDNQLVDIIMTAFDYFERATCIRLQRLRERPVDKKSLSKVEWIYITNPSGIRQCVHSNEKKVNKGVQIVVFGYDCMSVGEIVHEVMHVLGFSHEHTRPDRDAYISVLWDNIKPGYKKYFEVRKEDSLMTLPYDYSSVLHYPPRAFSRNGQITIMTECWRDQKRKARVEGGAQNKTLNATGNRGDVPELSQNSQLILSTIGEEMALGIGPEESPIGAPPPLVPAQSPREADSEPGPSSLTPPAAAPTATLRPRRVRKVHPPDRFINAQLQMNQLMKAGLKLGQRQGLSETDVEKVGMIFGQDCIDRNRVYLLKTCPAVAESKDKKMKPVTAKEVEDYFNGRIWPFGIVNYKLRDRIEFSIEEKENIKAVIRHIEKETCIEFRDVGQDDDDDENNGGSANNDGKGKFDKNNSNILQADGHWAKIILKENDTAVIEGDNEEDELQKLKAAGKNPEIFTLPRIVKVQRRSGNETTTTKASKATSESMNSNKISKDVDKKEGKARRSKRSMPQSPARRHANSILIFTRSAKPGCECPKPGLTDGNKIIELSTDCFNSVNDLLHVFGHILGLDHQHNMHDRDDFLHIQWNDLTDEVRDEMKNKLPVAASAGFPYDYQSVMHYPWLQIKNGVANIMFPVWNDGWAMGHWQGLSTTDVQKLNMLYFKQCVERKKHAAEDNKM